MLRKLLEIISVFKSTDSTTYSFKNISKSVITIISRSTFAITEKWFENLLAISYDTEIKSKYIPELHEINHFERENLTEILNFQNWKRQYSNQLRICTDYLDRFKDSYRDFYQVLDVENIKIIDAKHPFIKSTTELISDINDLKTDISHLIELFYGTGYEILSKKSKIQDIINPIKNPLSFKRSDWSKFLEKEPNAFNVVNQIFQNYNQVYYQLDDLNRLLDLFKNAGSNMMIVGKAGTGKTHISAHLTNKIKANGDYILFFKPKQFNGDNVNFNERLLQLMQVPPGYTLNEILEKLNNFALSNNKRCFFIIDALNETTKSTIGFSNIWRDNLQEFINQIELYSHLYIVCTLRTSYIDHIWNNLPSNLAEIRGFEKTKDRQALCKRYFEYYKITALNFHNASLKVFTTPLLLDLYCKLINENREEQKEITLDINTYLQIFEDYITNVSKEVQHKLGLQKRKLIRQGFSISSEKFFQNNEAIISIDDFSDAFDSDDSVSVDNSIARAVLEGYLIFIKDVVNKNEIVLHTQQEVGGYLLAKELSAKFLSIIELLENRDFEEKIIGNDPNKQHQLRLDILKFLIALRPEIISHLKNGEGLSLSWWYLYNGFRPGENNNIPKYLLEQAHILNIEEILDVSSTYWADPNHEFNFNFIAKILEKLDLWEFDACWTFYIYKEAELLFEFIGNQLNVIKESKLEYDKIVAKFIAFITATNIRELRDLATVYLIEFGKKHPIELLELTEYSLRLVDEYIYERLASCCYGVCLIFQNDSQFVQNTLPEFATRLYNIQFKNNPIHPVYNYIVVDSIKHLIDLAIYKGVFSLRKSEIKRICEYRFNTPEEWVPPTSEQRKNINKSTDMSWPEPIKMDFAIYTIPRLIDDEYKNRKDAIANVYKRVFELGYKSSDYTEVVDVQFRDFYFGNRIYGNDGKVDRLGKKYLWKAFFDYAGVLLQKGKLNVFEKYSGMGYYERLGDVDIDISMPFEDYKLSIKLYDQELIKDRSNDPNWPNDIKVDTIEPLFEHTFNNGKYIMLRGMVEQRVNEEYKTRSYLLTETVFIKKNKHLQKAKESSTITFTNWDLDNHYSPDHLRRTYFGELYWADNICQSEPSNISIPTGGKVKEKRKVGIWDIFQRSTEYVKEDIGKEIEVEYDEKIQFKSEPTLAEYLWESDSTLFKGYSEYYPSLKMGKSLGLKSDPMTGRILDPNLGECFNCISYRDGFSENNFNYMRSDLLKKYMKTNNLALLYQVKQHSYEENSIHNRSMKYFILE